MAVSIVGSTGFVAAHVQPAGEHLSRLSLLPAFGARLDGVPAGLAKAAVLQQARKWVVHVTHCLSTTAGLLRTSCKHVLREQHDTLASYACI